MYLLDTNVISELRKTRPDRNVISWAKSIPQSNFHISTVTLGEIQIGIERTRKQDWIKAESIEEWADRLELIYKILPMDAAIFRT